jgi:hypothetical protein
MGRREELRVGGLAFLHSFGTDDPRVDRTQQGDEDSLERSECRITMALKGRDDSLSPAEFGRELTMLIIPTERTALQESRLDWSEKRIARRQSEELTFRS